ncbi:hypothetical protein N7492_000384 [Penicillium capsulatum]|uniref:MARVEL domain-containing protein n=1 Tax=Penicillium capsulatum TaxID=69766 RepID=A0A9W9LYN9_9EURO|nr:hypothetical protein N7492_000384 [Penicillium capsulatum]KAJ6130552.1 hypothetical protein N7512_003332 [Penicillium capsulatum]
MLAFKVLELGYSQAKKHKAKKQAKQQQAQQPPYPNHQPYPMAEYPPNVAPGADVHFPPPSTPAEPTSKRAKLASMFVSALRFLQFVFGLTVIGLYGRDVHHDHSHNDTWHAKWVFALIAAFLASVTAAIHMALPFCMRRVSYRPSPALKLPQFLWEFVLCVLWLTLFGIFGKMYIGVHPSGDKGVAGLGDASKIDRMRHAVWIDLINLAMWVATASWVLLRWLKSRRAGAVGDGEKV